MQWLDTAAELAKGDTVERLVGGASGAAIAAYWFPGNWIAKATFGVVSLAASYHGSILLQHFFGGGSGLAGVFGWISAVFGMTAVSRVLTALAKWDARPAVQRIAEILLGASVRRTSGRKDKS